MKLISATALLCISFAAFSQNNCIINANIKGLKAGQWVYCQAQGDEQKDSVKTIPGRFQIKLNIPNGGGNIYTLQIGKGYTDYNFTMLYLDQGSITLTGNGPDFKNIKPSGNASSKDMSAYNNFIDLATLRHSLQHPLQHGFT